jgi:hypothetical protein
MNVQIPFPGSSFMLNPVRLDRSSISVRQHAGILSRRFDRYHILVCLVAGSGPSEIDT